MLIRNIDLKNRQLLVSGKTIRFNEEGIGDIPDQELFEALLKIKGFTDINHPAVNKVDLREVKSISIDDLEEAKEEEVEEEVKEEEVKEEEIEEKPKSKKKGR
ncbi:MAG TPA: hypothetical protein PLS98_07115 [Dictyoglomaceae bacterium]|nr:hypothetical protein [Dictyoglomaceae bacterium]